MMQESSRKMRLILSKLVRSTLTTMIRIPALRKTLSLKDHFSIIGAKREAGANYPFENTRKLSQEVLKVQHKPINAPV